jgi:hypothetical protein
MPINVNGYVINNAVATGLKYKNIITRGLTYHLDASTNESFVNGTNYWYDMVGSNAAYMANITYSSNNGGTITIGSGNFIDCGNVVGSSSTFTICTWVNPGNSQTTYADIFDNNHTGARNFVCQQNVDNLNQYSFGVQASNSSLNRGTTTFQLTAGTWTFLSFTFDSSGTVVGYTNGSSFSTSTSGGSITYDSPYLRLGQWGGGGRNWNGTYGNWYYYNRALSASEILQNYNVQKSRFGL